MMLFALNVLFMMVWCAITRSFDPWNLLIGFLLGFSALWVVRGQFDSQYFQKFGKVSRLIWMFFFDLVLSSVKVAFQVLGPEKDWKPGILAVPLDCDRDGEITVLANLTTLTPGTLSLDVSADKSTLYIHAMDVSDPEGTVQGLKTGFEKAVIEALR
jgi:multicomponent Na+:H+ antiporter subunit E